MKYFNTNLETIEWVVLAYLLTITALLLTFGRLADIWGRKKVYTIGFAIFTAGSVTCGLATSPQHLIFSRVAQAVGAAMLQSNGLAITSAIFPASERGRALGINGTVVATGTTIGPTIGGLLVSAFGWQSIFLVNLPVGIIGITMALFVLQEERISVRRTGPEARFDPVGAGLVAVALVALLLALNQGPQRGWTSGYILVLFAVAAVAFACFLVVESRVVAPLLSLALFRIRAFAAGSLAAFCSFLAIAANTFLMPFYLQLVLGYSPAKAGLFLTPTSLTLAVIAPISGWLSDRFGARILSSLGLGLSCVALLTLGRLDAHAHYSDVLLRLIFLGVGIGIFNSPNSSAVLGSVSRAQYGVAGGFLSMVRNSGQVIGVAVAGAVLINAIAPVVGALGLNALQTATAGVDHTPLVNAFLSGMRHAYTISAALAAIGAVFSLSRGRRSQQAQPSKEQEAVVMAATD